jgi:hypothetical protein
MNIAFQKSFLGMVEALRSDASIYVAVAEIIAPDPSQIEAAEEKLGHRLGASLTEFYTFCGGIKLVWTHKEYVEDGIWEAEDAESEMAALTSGKPWLFKSGDLTGDPAGCIWIPSCKQVFGGGEEWSGLLDDQEDTFDYYRDQIGATANEATEQLLPFDYASSFYDFAFLMNGNPEPKLIRGEDSGACFTDSRVVSLSEYLDLLITSKGVVRTRINAMTVQQAED